jgi:hypothetical protein
MNARLLGATLAVVLASHSTADGHHPTARRYRADEQTTIDGVLVSLVYKAPHSFLHVQAPDRQNNMRVWAVECGNRDELRRRVQESALKPGDRVVVTGDTSWDEGAWRVRLRTLTRRQDGWRWRESVQ